MEPLRFTKWKGEDGIETYIKQQTGCKPYSGAGICPRAYNNTTILRSVDDTYYYDDDLSNPEEPKYTLFGHNGNQDENEKKFNKQLLDPLKTKHIFLYRVSKEGMRKVWYWYGKYYITGKTIKENVGKDYKMRKIVILSLKRA